MAEFFLFIIVMLLVIRDFGSSDREKLLKEILQELKESNGKGKNP